MTLIVIGALGTVPNVVKKRLEKLESRESIETRQTTVKIDLNTEKSPGNIKILAITQNTQKDHQLMLV